MNYMGDVHSILTFDGVLKTYPDEANRFIAYIGYGAPPVERITRRGYKQNGETVVDRLLNPRLVTITLWQKPACDRATYWNNRAELHDLLRPNRGGPIRLTLERPDGSKRAINLEAEPGALFDTPQTEDNNWEINETIDFIAPDPLWFNPGATAVAIARDSDQNLVFPITFPIVFGSGGAVYSATINYVGSWKTYPLIVITGPYEAVVLENESTGATISMVIPITAGQTRTLDLTPGAISITDQNGDDAFNELGVSSDLVDFTINPDPEAPGGVNVISAKIVSAGSATSLSISYNERFYAI